LHIQNDRPQLTPGFFVSIVLQGSPCSQFGATGLENNFPQVCFVVKFEASSSREEADLVGDMTARATAAGVLTSVVASAAIAGSVGAGSSLLVTADDALAAKNPLRLCWPLPWPFGIDCVLLFFAAGIGSVLAGRFPLTVLKLVDVSEVLLDSVLSSFCCKVLGSVGGVAGSDGGRIMMALSPVSLTVLFDFGNDGFRVNISLMLCLLSNS
jgi:hypothetical protein